MTQGNTCILVLCEYFTKWVEAFALSDHNTPSNADVLLTEVFLWFVVPRFIFLIKHQSSCQSSWRIYTSYSRSSAWTLVHIDCNRWLKVSTVHLSICHQSSVMSDKRIGTNTCPSSCVSTGQQSMRARCHTDYVAWVKTALEEGKTSRLRRHIRRRHNLTTSLNEVPHRPAHLAIRPVPPASRVPGYTPAWVVSQHHSYRLTSKQQCSKPSHKKRGTMCTSISRSRDTVSVPLQSMKKAVKASPVTLLPPQQPSLLTPPLRKGGILPITSDLNTHELPTLQPVSGDDLWDWYVTTDFSNEEPITVVSITPVSDSRTDVATKPVP